VAGIPSPKVLYIGAIGRSGSTLMERLLGQLPGVCPIGEAVYLWQRGILEGNRCGCGEPFRRCPFWHDVGTAAFGGWEKTDARRVVQLRAAVDRTRFIPLLLAPTLRPSFRWALDEYTSYCRRIYDAVGAVSGREVIIDSSKNASFAFCLRSCTTLDLRVVHAVRDSRAVAYSWTRRVRLPEAIVPRYMPTMAPARAAGQWNYINSALQLLANTGIPTLRVRYEDLVRAPEKVLALIAAFIGLTVRTGQLGFVGADEAGAWADLSVAHTVSGNPMRFKTGRTRICLDDEWRTAMATKDRLTVTALTLPLLRHYGYLARGPEV
jgi:hypothetical protein